MNKKIVFIPGWMYSPAYFKLAGGIDVWKEDIDFSQSVECDYFIGHSMGAAIALKLWSLNKEKDLILVNPFITQDNILVTISNWFKYAWKEGLNGNGFLGIKYLPKNFKRVLKFPEENYWEILQNVPKEKIKILHGEKDLFLCSPDICAKFREFEIEVIEVAEAGHDWHKNFDDIIEKIINS